MIDWVTAEIPLLHTPISSGRVTSTDENGEVEWEARKRTRITGSHDKGISIRSDGGDGNGMATHLLILGNPSKFLQGHNIFGSDDLVSLVYDTFLRCCRAIGVVPTLSELRAVKQGFYRVKKVDVNYSFDLPSRGDVRAWIRAAEYKSKTRHGRPSSKGGTLYWGKDSKRWALKAYSKGDEIERPGDHGLPPFLKKTDLPKWADNKLRIELVLHGKQLDELGLSKASEWTCGKAEAVYRDYLTRLKMSEQITLTDEVLNDLPHKLRSTYALWRQGDDLRNLLSKPTYYRHRSELLDQGINIDIRPDHTPSANVVPLIKILEAQQAVIPQWAFDQDLIHSSAIA